MQTWSCNVLRLEGIKLAGRHDRAVGILWSLLRYSKARGDRKDNRDDSQTFIWTFTAAGRAPLTWPIA